MADIPFPTSLLPGYQSPQQMALAGANVGNIQAGTALLGQQTIGAGIANERSGLQLGLLQDYLNGSQTSSAPAAAAPSSPEPIGNNSPITSDDIGSKLFNAFAPLPTARPPSVIQQQMKANIAGLPEVAQNIGQQYDAQIAGENQRRQLAANLSYQTADSIEKSPPGAAFETLQRFSPDKAAAMKQQYANDTPEQLDSDIRAYAQHTALYSHQYSGRPTDMQNGVLVDKLSGSPVTGSSQVLTGLDAKGKQQAFEYATAQIDVPMSDGTTQKIERWQAPVSAGGLGGIRPEQYVVQADKAARTSANTGAPAPAASASAPTAPASPNTSTTATAVSKDSGQLPGVDIASLPKAQAAPVVVGRTQSPAEAITANSIATEKQAQLKDSNAQYGEAQKEQALINAAQGEANRLASNARLAGPGSEIAKTWAQVKTAVTGAPPDAYVDLGALDKLLLQMGAQNIRQVLTGQRITNQEFMQLLTKGNPNTEQPLPTINRLLGFLSAQNDYDRRFQLTKQAALNAGANPMTVDTDIGTKADRSSYVAGRTGITPAMQNSSAPGRPGQQRSGLQEGATDISKSGKPIVVKNGQWQYQ
jgi:hypothetical protein